jgi:beta-glucosidase
LTPYFAFGQHVDYPAVNYQKYDLADTAQVDGVVYTNKHIDVRGDNPTFARKVAAESTVSVRVPLALGVLVELSQRG